MAVHASTYLGVLQLPDTLLRCGENVTEMNTRNIAYLRFLHSFDLAAQCNLRMLSLVYHYFFKYSSLLMVPDLGVTPRSVVSACSRLSSDKLESGCTAIGISRILQISVINVNVPIGRPVNLISHGKLFFTKMGVGELWLSDRAHERHPFHGAERLEALS
jgi:hypothetical protein